ncbi:heavy-metal-associated domain-containing protein [Arthrobacter sp. UC242_113]|uniref:heavy-metal-associated domain-containing protein n=1 Tax=Arthrobacter sp. UC242_113 TaxID=3374550 RepID=UPI003756ABB4
MRGTDKRIDLPLTASAGGCACCRAEAPGRSSSAAAADAEYRLEGLTCGHCVASVEKAVAAVHGVEAAAVELVPGGLSRLRISGSAGEAAVREAVNSAGYNVHNS